MARWPVETPPKEVLRTNLQLAPGPVPDPITFDGPLNLFIQLYGTALAAVTSAQAKADYETIYPAPTAQDDDGDLPPD